MDTTLKKTKPKKYIDQYSETTLILVWTIKGFATQVLISYITEASISLASFNNGFIPFGLPKLVIIDSDGTKKHLQT